MTALGLVVARFYEDLAVEMEASARDRAAERDATIAETASVHGVYDAPLAADRLARRDGIDAVVVLGAVVEGDTDHDQVVAHAAARGCTDVSLRRDTPVAFGVAGPGMSGTEARERIDYAADAVGVAIDLIAELSAGG